jgi:hypothetical protein
MDSFAPNFPNSPIRSEARLERIGDSIRQSTDRVVAAITQYIEFNNRVHAANDIKVNTRLDTVESRLAVVEKRLNIPPSV